MGGGESKPEPNNRVFPKSRFPIVLLPAFDFPIKINTRSFGSGLLSPPPIKIQMQWSNLKLYVSCYEDKKSDITNYKIKP